MRITNIEWETDGIEIELPTEMNIPNDVDDVAGYIADKTGWLCTSYNVDIPTKFLAFRLESEDDSMEITEHMSMNGYTYDTNCEKTIFIIEDEADYLETMLKDRNMPYTIL